MTAGHCLSGQTVVQFRIPNSSSDCYTNNPGVADQFPITASDGVDGGVGVDFGAIQVGANSSGQLPYDRYGVYMEPAGSVPSSGSASVSGYGVDDECVYSQTLQSHTGSISGFSGTTLYYDIDGTYGKLRFFNRRQQSDHRCHDPLQLRLRELWHGDHQQCLPSRDWPVPVQVVAVVAADVRRVRSKTASATAARNPGSPTASVMMVPTSTTAWRSTSTATSSTATAATATPPSVVMVAVVALEPAASRTRAAVMA